jgi:hypothetical protein
MMSKRSLAAWRQAQGFGILNIISPTGEHFLVEAQATAKPSEPGFESWVEMSESRLTQYLVERGFSEADTADAIQLSRQWATTITNSTFFPAPPKAN